MSSRKRKTRIPALATTFILVFVIGGGGCSSPHAGSLSPTTATTSPAAAAHRLENGAYLILSESPEPPKAQDQGTPGVVLVYDRRKYSGAPPDEPLSYVTIDPHDYIPMIIEGAPQMRSDGQGKSILTVSLTRQNAQRAEAFTRAHLGGRIAMVVDGEIITLHKIRAVLTDGKLQITRCTDNACEVIRSKLVN